MYFLGLRPWKYITLSDVQIPYTMTSHGTTTLYTKLFGYCTCYIHEVIIHVHEVIIHVHEVIIHVHEVIIHVHEVIIHVHEVIIHVHEVIWLLYMYTKLFGSVAQLFLRVGISGVSTFASITEDLLPL